VTSLNSIEEPSNSSAPLFIQTIHWHPPLKGITFVELFVSIGMGLVVVLEAKLKVKCYIHVDNRITSNQATHHHIQQLLTMYSEQLSPAAIQGCFNKLLQNITLISDEDLRRLSHIDLLIAE